MYHFYLKYPNKKTGGAGIDKKRKKNGNTVGSTGNKTTEVMRGEGDWPGKVRLDTGEESTGKVRL